MTATDLARYRRARLLAFRGWQASQPQYVIPGLDDALEGGAGGARQECLAAAGVSLERVSNPHPSFLPVGRGALDLIDRHRAATPSECQRGPVPEEAS